MKKFLLLFFLVLITSAGKSQERRQVIIDADTGNEVDDPFAIVRALIEPSLNVTAINATQWQVSQWAVENTMEESYRLDQALLDYMQLNHIKVCRGSMNRMFDWGDKAQHSEAAYEIIKQARKIPSGSKLTVITLGALTNVASALLIDQEISSKIVVYWLGSSFDFENIKSKQIDFNAVMDIQAVDYMFESEVEIHIVPVNVAEKMKYRYDETSKQIKGKHLVADFILNRWHDHLDGSRIERTLWDLVPVQVLIYPEKATQVRATIFKNKNIWIVKDFDAEFFKKDFFNSISTLAGY